jgi:hypothetical protein
MLAAVVLQARTHVGVAESNFNAGFIADTVLITIRLSHVAQAVGRHPDSEVDPL